MKYVVNTRGGAKQVDDALLASLLSAGCIEITKKQFEERQYYPEYDKGPKYSAPTTTRRQISTQTTAQKRTAFETRIV